MWHIPFDYQREKMRLEAENKRLKEEMDEWLCTNKMDEVQRELNRLKIEVDTIYDRGWEDGHKAGMNN